MIITFTNVIGAIRNSFSVVRSGLKMWLGFETSSIDGDSQITPDKSGNNNVGELFTGKALDFNGSTDKVDFASFTTQIKCAVFWVKPLGTGVESILGFGGAYSGSKYIKSVSNNIQSAGLSSVSVYVNGVSTTSVPVNQWSRVVVNFSLLTPQDLTFGYGFDTCGNIELSNVQLYDENLSTYDIAYDYANPQNLVTDRIGTSIGLSNLKGYWALSEGAGSLAYDSSGEGNNGTISGATYEPAQPRIPQLGMQNWSKGFNSLTFSEDFSNAVWIKGTGTSVTGGFTDPLGGNTAYKASYDGVGDDPFIYDDANNTTNMRSLWARTVSGTGQIHLTSHNSNSNSLFNLTTEWQRVSAIPTSGAGIVNYYLVDFRGSTDLTEVLVWGAQIDDGTTLGGYRPTSGSSVPSTTLIPKPTIPTKDIFGSLVRDRLNSFNLDGSGYAEVADDASINPTTEITIQCWIQSNTENDKGLVAKWIGTKKDYMLYKTTNKFSLYIGTTPLQSGTLPSSGWVNIAGTYNGSTMKTFINGVESTSQGRTGSIPNSDNVLDIGRYAENNTYCYSERISDVLLYDTALDADEIENNYNAGLSAHTNN